MGHRLKIGICAVTGGMFQVYRKTDCFFGAKMPGHAFNGVSGIGQFKQIGLRQGGGQFCHRRRRLFEK